MSKYRYLTVEDAYDYGPHDSGPAMLRAQSHGCDCCSHTAKLTGRKNALVTIAEQEASLRADIKALQALRKEVREKMT